MAREVFVDTSGFYACLVRRDDHHERAAELLRRGKGQRRFLTTDYVLDVSVISDIAFPTKIEHLCKRYRPAVVFHAAAHKHVPFMEDNPEESVLNNIFGTTWRRRRWGTDATDS